MTLKTLMIKSWRGLKGWAKQYDPLLFTVTYAIYIVVYIVTSLYWLSQASQAYYAVLIVHSITMVIISVGYVRRMLKWKKRGQEQ